MFKTLRRCANCRALNRIPASRLADTAKCGGCGSLLGPSNEPIAVGSGDFDDVLREVKTPILVDFWASWCGPCRMAAPEVDALAKATAGRAVVLKVDTEENPDLAARFQIQSIPHFIVFKKGGAVFERHSGVASSKEMRQWLERAGA
jgi:thioredoxin 2